MSIKDDLDRNDYRYARPAQFHHLVVDSDNEYCSHRQILITNSGCITGRRNIQRENKKKFIELRIKSCVKLHLREQRKDQEKVYDATNEIKLPVLFPEL